MKNQYEQKRKAVIAAMSVAVLSLLGGIGYSLNQKIDDVNVNTVDISSESTTVEVIAKADSKQKETKNKAETKTTGQTTTKTKEEKVQKSKEKGNGILTDKVRTPEEAVPPSAPLKNATTNKNSGTKNNSQSKSKNKSTNKNGKTTNKNSKNKSQPYNGQIKGDMIYVEGFGWVKYSGGGSIVHDLPGAGTGEIVADM